MIAIESINKKQNFISGIFKTKAKADKAFQKIIEKEKFHFVEYNNIQIPFFIIEKENKFKYYQNKNEVLTEIKKIKVVNEKDEDISYCTLYFIKDEHINKNPEQDSMGSLDHLHIDNDSLKRIDELFSTF
jgi:hypothetical protein